MASTYVRLPVLFVAWREPVSRIFRVVGRLVAVPSEKCGFQFEFAYTRGTTIASDAGFQGLPLLDHPLDFDRISSGDVPPKFFMEGHRSDSPLVVLDDLAIGACHPKDESFEVFAAPYEQGPTADGDTCYLLNFYIHGLRYLDQQQSASAEQLAKGDLLVVSHELVDEDPDALAVRTAEGTRVGYLPRYLAPDTRLIEHDDTALQIRVLENLGSHLSPNRRIRCQLRACWPSGFRPFDLPTFQPVGNATRLYGHNAVLT